MRTKEAILKEINKDLPPLDWKKGSRLYLARFLSNYSPENVKEFMYNKPLEPITPEDPTGSILSDFCYLHNFANTIHLLNLPRGSRILDVACGGGWFSHWLRKIGYDARGIDISADFIDHARQRIAQDPYLSYTEEELATIYSVVDVEQEKLPKHLHGTFDAVILESCLHHFYNPISAMTHIVEGLTQDGVALILEGENRTGPIKEEYMKIMHETSTLERPYHRKNLREILEHAGLPSIAFLGSTPGYFAESDRISHHMTQYLADNTRVTNICICARNSEALRRVVPSFGQVNSPNDSQESAATPHVVEVVKKISPYWLTPFLRFLWRAWRRHRLI